MILLVGMGTNLKVIQTGRLIQKLDPSFCSPEVLPEKSGRKQKVVGSRKHEG